VEANEDTNTEVSGDARTGREAGGVANPWRKTRVELATTATTKATMVKVAEKKKRKRKTSPLLAVETLVIPTPLSREVESNEEEEDEAIEEPPVAEE
jgi:hypothetical protein